MMNIQIKIRIAKYIVGFVLSLATTLVAYLVVKDGLYTGTELLWVLGGLAITQMAVQLVFFLHIGEAPGVRVRTLAFSFMSLILVITVVGSIWIMHHLNYRMMDMTPDQKTEYMMGEKDKGF